MKIEIEAASVRPLERCFFQSNNIMLPAAAIRLQLSAQLSPMYRVGPGKWGKHADGCKKKFYIAKLLPSPLLSRPQLLEHKSGLFLPVHAPKAGYFYGEV